MPRYADYHRTVIGFHGTRREVADEIVRGGAFMPSRNRDDWLGHGIYFWEYGPQQAFHWARKRYGAKADIAVLGSMIRLGNCLDLLDPMNIGPVVKAYHSLKASVSKIPRNYNSKKYLDCAIFQHFYEIQRERNELIDTARAVYVPTDNGKRLWHRSWLYHETHVQLCVRKPENILGTWLVKPMEHRDEEVQ